MREHRKFATLVALLLRSRYAVAVETTSAAATAASTRGPAPSLFADPPAGEIAPASQIIIHNKPINGEIATMSVPGAGKLFARVQAGPSSWKVPTTVVGGLHKAHNKHKGNTHTRSCDLCRRAASGEDRGHRWQATVKQPYPSVPGPAWSQPDHYPQEGCP